jgi:N-acetylmuramoyl-L-alanine amidase-like protein
MKNFPSLPLALLLLLTGCSSQESPGQSTKIEEESIKVGITKVTILPEDKEVLEKLFALHSENKGSPISALMVKVGSFFVGTQYQAHTLEGETEELVVNLREFDCTTFVVSCLAISRSIKSGLVNFMSTHPGSYRQLITDTSLIGIIAQQEQEISAREMFYIPTHRIKDVEPLLREGDIVGLTTSIRGLDISHVGILVKESGRLHLMHASSRAKKVIISEETLEEFLKNSKSTTGIMVARPQWNTPSKN